MRLSTDVALSMILLLAASDAALANTKRVVAWPNPGLNAAHTAFNKAEKAFTPANVANATIAWTFQTNDVVVAQPVEQDGTMFVLSADNNLYAVSASTGAQLWSYPVGNYYATGVDVGSKLVYSTCVVQQNSSNTNGGVCAFDVKTGKLAWSYAILNDGGGPVTSFDTTGPVLDSGRLVFAIADTAGYHVGYLVALDAKTGAVDWRIGNCDNGDVACGNGQSGAPPAIDGGGVFFGFGTETQGYNASLCRADERTGHLTWCHEFVSGNPGDIAPTVANGMVMYASANTDGSTSTLTALDESTGTTLWATQVNGDNNSVAPAVAKGRIYFTAGGNLYAVSAKDGHVLWSYPYGGPDGTLAGGVTIANGIAFGLCGGAQFCAFDAATGKVLASSGDRYSVTGYTPTVVNGTVFESCDYHDICAYIP